MLAFHGDTAIKDKYTSRVRQHREERAIIQTRRFWLNGKGNALGCTFEQEHDVDGGWSGTVYRKYETELGIPAQIAFLKLAIFAGLPAHAAPEWPERVLSAIPVGADLSRVWYQFASWLLRGSELFNRCDIIHEAKVARKAITALVSRSSRYLAEDVSDLSQEVDPFWAAWAEDLSADIWTSASIAEWAVWTAANVAGASIARVTIGPAAWPAAAAANVAAYEKMADKLIELIAAAGN